MEIKEALQKEFDRLLSEKGPRSSEFHAAKLSIMASLINIINNLGDK